MTNEAKTVVITGVTSGIGLATTRALVLKGYRVIGIGRNQDSLTRLQLELGEAFAPIAADLSDLQNLRVCQAAIESVCSSVYAFISNAAECAYQSVLQLPIEQLARMFTTNVVAPAALLQAIAPRLSVGGAFIHISSITARQLPGAKFAAYAATKVAMDTLIEGLRLELAPRQIRVATVTPGLVDTPIYTKVKGFDAARQKLSQQVPEWLRPEEVAATILFVLSQPPQVTIQDLVITPTLQAR